MNFRVKLGAMLATLSLILFATSEESGKAFVCTFVAAAGFILVSEGLGKQVGPKTTPSSSPEPTLARQKQTELSGTSVIAARESLENLFRCNQYHLS